VGAGFAIAACILLRPDGGILLAALESLWHVWLETMARAFKSDPRLAGGHDRRTVLPASARTLDRSQPANASPLPTARPSLRYRAGRTRDTGFNRWVKTWILDYASVEEIYWNVPGDKIDPDKLPSRAFDSLPSAKPR